MAKFLTTQEVSGQLAEIIRSANERIVLISPYLQIDERYKRRIESKARSGVEVHIVYRKPELRPEEEKWLDSVDSIKTSRCKDLHAKCYFNESMALLTSMNLYRYSEGNNYEMGVLISLEEDEALYNDVVDEADHIIEDVSEKVRVPKRTRKRLYTRSTQGSRIGQGEAPESGFCIRCEDTIPANPLRPYCGRHYKRWNRYKVQGKYCHTCGAEHSTTKLKPVCYSCYQKYRTALEFADG